MLNQSNIKKKSPITLVEVIEQPVFNNIYQLACKPYLTSEYIPNHLIPMIMKHHFPSSNLIYSFEENHSLYKIKIKDLLENNVKNWSFNRPPDLARCPDIARYIYNSKKPMDTQIFLFYNNVKQIFEVLDGIHRLTALKLIKESNSKQMDILNPSDFGYNNDAQWLFEKDIIVNIRFNSNLGDLVEIFKNLNKSQAVPDLYIHDHAKEKRQIIDAIANEWFVKYKSHFSGSTDPKTGNTNRNRFVNLLDKLYDKHNIDETCPYKLRQLLDDANTKLMGKIPSKVSINIRVKCKETGCYLFIFKNDKLEEFI
jgi:hypothetical protein